MAKWQPKADFEDLQEFLQCSPASTFLGLIINSAKTQPNPHQSSSNVNYNFITISSRNPIINLDNNQEYDKFISSSSSFFTVQP